MDLEEFNRIKEQQQLEMQEFWETHKEYMKLYNAGKLPRPTVQWHEKVEDIDLSLQNQRFDPILLQDGYTIILNVDIEALLNELPEVDATAYRKRKLYDSSANRNSITSVLKCWYSDQKLIPPLIMVFDQQYINEVARGSLPSTEFRAIDGKHRLRIAYYAGVTELPILVWNRQANLVKSRLGM